MELPRRGPRYANRFEMKANTMLTEHHAPLVRTLMKLTLLKEGDYLHMQAKIHHLLNQHLAKMVADGEITADLMLKAVNQS